jgi:Plasmid pRiA4b ORF-3-like protein
MAKTLITLRASLEPKLYREIEIAGEASLYKLAEAINTVFGFDFDHAFGFYDNLKNPYKSKTVYELFKDMGEPSVAHARSVKRSKVQEAFEGDGKALAFLFDYGDEWLFQVKRLSAQPRDAPKTFWKLIKSVGDAPEQYPPEEEDADDRPFAEKYEMIKMHGITVVRRKKGK